jgi:hypothetical protein
MISVEKCKEILGDNMTDPEVERLRESLYAMVDSILDNYFQEFANIEVCKKQSSTAESLLQSKALRGMDSIVKNIDVESMQSRETMML